MTNPCRAMCAELVAAVDLLCGSGDSPGQPGSRLILTVHVEALDELANRARALLADPEPEGPTDEEIMELMPQQMRDDLATAARAMIGFDSPKVIGAVDHARAALAKWGNQ